MIPIVGNITNIDTTKYEPFCDEVAAKFGRTLVSLATKRVILFRRSKLVGLATTDQY